MEEALHTGSPQSREPQRQPSACTCTAHELRYVRKRPSEILPRDIISLSSAKTEASGLLACLCSPCNHHGARPQRRTTRRQRMAGSVRGNSVHNAAAVLAIGVVFVHVLRCYMSRRADAAQKLQRAPADLTPSASASSLESLEAEPATTEYSTRPSAPSAAQGSSSLCVSCPSPTLSRDHNPPASVQIPPLRAHKKHFPLQLFRSSSFEL